MDGRNKVFSPAHQDVVIPREVANRISYPHIEPVLSSEQNFISYVYIKRGITYYIITDQFIVNENFATKIC